MIMLTGKEKTLVHLKSSVQDYQENIEKAVGVSHRIVSEAVRKLKEEGLINIQKRYIESKGRRINVYFLTDKGRNIADEIEKRISNETITVIDLKGKEKRIKFSEINDFLKKTSNKNFTVIEILNILENNKLELTKLIQKTSGNIDWASERPEIKHFYGRKKEIKTVDDFINSKKTKVLSIRGVAGIGKTTLITKALEKHKHKYNVFWHRFHEFSTAESMLRYLNDFLSTMRKNKLRIYLMSNKNIEKIDALMILEEEMKKINAIMVFDDIHKIKDELSVFLNEFLQILKRINDVKVILSGRQIPRIYDEKDVLDAIVKEITLEGMDKKSSRQLLNEKGIKTGTEKIYSATKGHPLILELVKNEKTVSEDAYSFLKNEVYNKLFVDEKEILNLCSVFRYPFKNKLFTENNIKLDIVDDLVDKSLMQRSGDIYDEHDLIKEFMYKRLNKREKIRYHRTAGKYYEKETGDMALLEKLHHYIEADYQEETVKTMLKHGKNLIKRGFKEETIGILNVIDKQRIPAREWIKILLLRGNIQRLNGNLDTALSTYNMALKMSEENENLEGIAESYLGIGRVYEEKSRWDDALINLNKYLELSKKTGNKKNVADAYHNIGYIHWREGKLNDAEKYFKLCLKHTRPDADEVITANAYTGLGFVNKDRGKYDTAIRLYNKSMDVFEKTGNKYGVVRAYNNIAVTYARKKEYDRAIEYHIKQISLAESIGDFRGIAYELIGVSGDYAEKDMLKKALDYCRKGLSLAERLDEKLLISLAHNNMGVIMGKRKTWEKADEHFNASIRIAKEIGSITRLADAHFDYAKMYLAKGDLRKAKTQYQNALKCYEKLGNKEKIEEIKKELAQVSMEHGV